jgi:hypothetical protein
MSDDPIVSPPLMMIGVCPFLLDLSVCRSQASFRDERSESVWGPIPQLPQFLSSGVKTSIDREAASPARVRPRCQSQLVMTEKVLSIGRVFHREAVDDPARIRRGRGRTVRREAMRELRWFGLHRHEPGIVMCCGHKDEETAVTPPKLLNTRTVRKATRFMRPG